MSHYSQARSPYSVFTWQSTPLQEPKKSAVIVKDDKERVIESYHHIRPLEKNLSAPLRKDVQPSGHLTWGSSSPSQLIRTLVYFPPTESSSTGSSSTSGVSPWSFCCVPPAPPRGRSPTKYTREPGTSESNAVHSLSAGENAILSSEVRMVMCPWKRRGRETETSP